MIDAKQTVCLAIRVNCTNTISRGKVFDVGRTKSILPNSDRGGRAGLVSTGRAFNIFL